MDGVLPLSSRSTEAAADANEQQQQQQQVDGTAAAEDKAEEPYMVLDGGELRDALLRSPRWCELVAGALTTPVRMMRAVKARAYTDSLICFSAAATVASSG